MTVWSFAPESPSVEQFFEKGFLPLPIAVGLPVIPMSFLLSGWPCLWLGLGLLGAALDDFVQFTSI